MQDAAEGAHLARGFSCGGHKDAALVLGEIEALAFSVVKLHACLRPIDTVHMNFVSRRAATAPCRGTIIRCSRDFLLDLRRHPDTELLILYQADPVGSVANPAVIR